jgi:hypothetical protein
LLNHKIIFKINIFNTIALGGASYFCPVSPPLLRRREGGFRGQRGRSQHINISLDRAPNVHRGFGGLLVEVGDTDEFLTGFPACRVTTHRVGTYQVVVVVFSLAYFSLNSIRVFYKGKNGFPKCYILDGKKLAC